MPQFDEGYWINARTGDYRAIDEHRRWISRSGNAHALKLDPRLDGLIPRPNSESDRLWILLVAMEGGFVRVRRHGPERITFEHTIPFEKSLPAIGAFLGRTDLAGPVTTLTITDLRTARTIATGYEVFRRGLDTDPNGLLEKAMPAGFDAYSHRTIRRHLDAIGKHLSD